jgi:signal transduction histidine kinase
VVKSNIPLRAELARGLPLLQADRVHLQQVILNLIINAVEAMSSLTEGTRELLISTAKIRPGVLVAVRDSGPGQAPATLEHVFDPFYTTKATGLGMGLSICRLIIEAHGGRLWASANAPRGAIFQFTLIEGSAAVAHKERQARELHNRMGAGHEIASSGYLNGRRHLAGLFGRCCLLGV